MKKVPEIISTKDLSYLEDQFNWHFTLCKKAETYSHLVTDETISKYFNEVSKKHQKVCETILNILKEAA